MSNFSFTEDAFAEYIYWQTQDRKTLKKINALLNDINRHPFEGLGKPEPLKGNYKGFWSRRIDDANRIIYRVTDDYIEITQCKGHYNDYQQPHTSKHPQPRKFDKSSKAGDFFAMSQ